MSPATGDQQDAPIGGFPEKISHHLNLYITLMKSFTKLTDGQLLRQPLNEASNCLSHLSQYVTAQASPKVRNDNLNKARSHLERACLDLYKLTYLTLARLVEEIARDRIKYVTCREKGPDFWRKREEFRRLARKARFHELVHVGKGTAATMRLYQEAIDIGLDLHGRRDPKKEAELRDRERKAAEKRAQEEDLRNKREKRRDLYNFLLGMLLYIPGEMICHHLLGPLNF